MLFTLSLLILLTNMTLTSGNAGSTLFYTKKAGIDCWNEADIIKLRARKAFEELLPAEVNPEQINSKYIRQLLQYFRKTIDGVKVNDDQYVTSLLQEAVADTIGAHLRREILPATRFAYYAGYVPYKNTKEINDFFNEMKMMLNTQGLGWKGPARTPVWANLTVAKLMIGVSQFLDPCSCLVIKRDKDSCIHLPSPKLDNDYEPSAIALPFKVGGLVSLTAPKSQNVLLKYYTTASRCILSSSPKQCRHSDFFTFNNNMWHWMKREVAPHLLDEKLYAAFGGVLRIAAAVQTYGKGISRRNLFEYQPAYLSKWSPLKFLTQSYINIDTDWSPTLYIFVVFVVAIAIYLNSMLYSYLCGQNCQCSPRMPPFSEDVDIKYADVKSELHNEEKQIKPALRSEKEQLKTRTNSVALECLQTQKVFDLNENTEKLMSVAMTGDESESESSSVESGEAIDVVSNHSVPQIKTSISEIIDWRRKEEAVKKRSQSPMYSTSTVTYGVQPQGSASGSWSGSESSTSQTGTSSSDSIDSCSKSANSINPRNFAWAKRVVTSIRSNKSN